MFKDNMSAAEKEYESIMGYAAQIESFGNQENPYTSLTKEVSVPTADIVFHSDSVMTLWTFIYRFVNKNKYISFFGI